MSKPWIDNKMIDKIFSEHKVTQELEKEERGPRELEKEERGPRELEKEERGPRELEKEERGPRELKKEERSSQELEKKERSPQKLEKEEKSPQKLEKEEKSPQKLEKEKRGPRELEKEKRGPRELKKEKKWPRELEKEKRWSRELEKEKRWSRELEKEKRGPRELEKEKRGPRELEKEKRGPRELEKEKRWSRELEKEKRGPRELEKEKRGPRELKKEERSSQELEKEERSPPELKVGSVVRSMMVKTPFSTVAEVAEFLKLPILSSVDEEVFAFHNETDETFRELDTKLLATVHHYYEQPYCCLASSKLFEQRAFVELFTHNYVKSMETNHLQQPSWIPVHNLVSKQREEKKQTSSCIITKLPIEIGKYKMEIALEEKVMFEEEVEIEKVSKEIVLTNSKFSPKEVINSNQHPITIEKGTLLVEGYVLQRIEYRIRTRQNVSKVYQLLQKMVLELIVQLLQEQEVQVEIV
ncbi:BC_2427 family protein [Bacillus sp. DX1.1]|nr:hypothetical protein [Bacillus sp. DX1.1]